VDGRLASARLPPPQLRLYGGLPADVKRTLTTHATRDVEVSALPKRSARLDP